ncbi:MAG: hypothetical protein HOH66_02680, partial [Rhodospirillaceae bacterium]|nr:hypothetical protein [Rhodospirillaceae bacterium]
MTGLDIRPIAGAIGAEVADLDLSTGLGDTAVEALRAAFREHLVLFFRDQDLTPAQHSAFAGLFGEVDREPFVYPLVMPHAEGHPEVLRIVKEADDGDINFGGLWHYDVTYREQPHLGSVIHARAVPPPLAVRQEVLLRPERLAAVPADVRQRCLHA